MCGIHGRREWGGKCLDCLAFIMLKQGREELSIENDNEVTLWDSFENQEDSLTKKTSRCQIWESNVTNIRSYKSLYKIKQTSNFILKGTANGSLFVFKDRFDYFWLIIFILFMREKRSLYATGVFLEIPNSQSTMQGQQPYACCTWANTTCCGVLFNVQAEKILSEVGHFLVFPASLGYCSYFCLKALSPIPESPEVSCGSGCELAELAHLGTIEKLLGHSSPSLWGQGGQGGLMDSTWSPDTSIMWFPFQMQGELIKKQPTTHLIVTVLFKKRKSSVLFLTDTRDDIFF